MKEQPNESRSIADCSKNLNTNIVAHIPEEFIVVMFSFPKESKSESSEYSLKISFKYLRCKLIYCRKFIFFNNDEVCDKEN